ncbi:MAG: phosphoribosylanthranilate isomerase [candidate division NC10 bacterium]|nr:phosphoribosylanthranilate isomerase [candidate division NC10 bacterium]
MGRVRVKICGITSCKDALLAAEVGADALGFVFVQSSPRFIHPEEVARMRGQLPPLVFLVGVFADAPLEEVRGVVEACGLHAVQLHGGEDPQYCSSLGGCIIKAFRVKDRSSLTDLPRFRVAALLLDSYRAHQLGGTGETFDWDLAREAKGYGRLILSGGLRPENVAEAIRRVGPYAVDVCSGVEERPGRKDQGKVRRFLEEVARAEKSD